eukprot:2950293-Pyramimonas_sp.AAC.1
MAPLGAPARPRTAVHAATSLSWMPRSTGLAGLPVQPPGPLWPMGVGSRCYRFRGRCAVWRRVA